MDILFADLPESEEGGGQSTLSPAPPLQVPTALFSGVVLGSFPFAISLFFSCLFFSFNSFPSLNPSLGMHLSGDDFFFSPRKAL